MKKTILFLFLISFVLIFTKQGLALGTKSEGEIAAPKLSPAVEERIVPTEAMLIHHRYILTNVDKQEFVINLETSQVKPELSFNEGLNLSGAMCNRFMGGATLKDGVLKAERLASTMMICGDEQLNKLEQKFSQMMAKGANIFVSPDAKQLFLETGDESLTFKLEDLVQ